MNERENQLFKNRLGKCWPNKDLIAHCRMHWSNRWTLQ